MRSNRRRCSSGFKAVQKYFAKNKAVHVFLTFPHSTFSAKYMHGNGSTVQNWPGVVYSFAWEYFFAWS